jgi:hypothetical protein
MRKVVDTSALRSSELVEYLISSGSNQVIVPQLVLCECLQGNEIQNARKSLNGVAAFPKQISVLKSDAINFRMEPRKKGLQARLIDERLTAGIRHNLAFNLRQQGLSFDIVSAMIRYDGHQAKTVLSSYSEIAEKVKLGMMNDQSQVTRGEVRMMRETGDLPHSLLDRLENRIMKMVARSLDGVGLDVEKVSWPNALYSLPFRFSVSMEALAIDWVVYGGLNSRSEKNITNDIRDMSHVAYSTFYDGILAFDRRMLRVANLARILIRAFERRYANNIC